MSIESIVEPQAQDTSGRRKETVRALGSLSTNSRRFMVMPDNFDYSASITIMDVREFFPYIDPENLAPQDVVSILLHLFRQKQGFVDRGHEVNNRETAWVNAFLFRLKREIDDNGMESFVVENIGSSVDKMAALLEA